jgi:hypothetical protein
MIWRPQIEFQRLKEQPIIWIPLAILSVLHVIAMLFLTRVKTEEWDLNSVQTPPTISYTYMSAGLLLSDLLTFLLSIFIIAFIVYGVAKAFHSSVSIKPLISLVIFLQVIPTLGLILQSITHIFEWKLAILTYSLQDVFQLSVGQLSIALGFVTIFTVWNWVIASIGYATILRVPISVAVVTTLVMWYLPILISSFILTPQG